MMKRIEGLSLNPNQAALWFLGQAGYVIRSRGITFVEVLLLPINGKWGNLNVEQGVNVTAAVSPRFVLPNHYDLMALNSENPETFRWFCRQGQLEAQCVIPTIMQPFWE